MTNDKQKRLIHIRCNAEMRDAVAAAAERAQMSMECWIRQAVQAALDGRPRTLADRKAD